MNPADLNSRTFYTNRQDLFELRFKEIEEADLDDLLWEMEKTYNDHYGVTNSEITWNCFTDFEQVKVSTFFLLIVIENFLLIMLSFFYKSYLLVSQIWGRIS